MSDNKEELALIRLLIEQNGETIQMMRTLMKREADRQEGSQEYWKEIFDVAKSSGMLDSAMSAFIKKMREPRLVTPDQKPEEGTG